MGERLQIRTLGWIAWTLRGCVLRRTNCVPTKIIGTENLAAGTADDYSIATAIKSWTDEVSKYLQLFSIDIFGS